MDVRRLSTGIEGLDALLNGGIPEGHVVGVVGSYGTGKSTLALQFVHEGLKNGESCMIISLDETEEDVIANALSIGIDLASYGDRIKIYRLDAVELRKSLERVESDLPEMIRSMNARRLVIDPISVLEALYDEAGRFRMLSTFRKILKSAGITTIIVSEADKYNPTSSKYGLLEYICDGVICLKVVRKSELDEPTLGIEVVKMRRISHSRKPRPYSITDRGIVVYEEAEIF